MIDIEQLRPPKGSEAELVWLRGFEAGVMQMRADLHEQNRKLREALEVLNDHYNDRVASDQSWPDSATVSILVTIADLRKARAALAEGGEG